MKSAASFLRVEPYLPLLLVVIIASVATGCGSGSASNTITPKLTGNTAVTVVLTSTANGQLTEFDQEIQNLTLTSQSGKTVTLLSTQQPSEFLHLNGGIDPLITTTIPQDIYTAATATIGGAQFTCVTLIPASDPDGPALGTSTYAYGYTPASQVTVNVASPITITGQSMALSLDLLVAQSATYSSCYPAGTYSITPTFNLVPMTIASPATNAGNGEAVGIEGSIVSLNSEGSGFTLSVAEGPFGTRTIPVTANSATVFQGIGSFSALAPGMFVDMDGGLQADGSLLATRVAVDDPSALNIVSGPVLVVSSSLPVVTVYGRQEQGPLLSLGPGGQSGLYVSTPLYDFSSAVFQISGQVTNLQSLPFVASFSGSNMVPGQNVDVTSPALSLTGGVYTPANTVTLIPQALDAQVLSSSTEGGFTVYQVELAFYDLFPELAVQPGQITLLTNPSIVYVYVDSQTQLLNQQSLSGGGTFRFYGLVFNDNGTLRMDCAQVNDGAAFAPNVPAAQINSLQRGVAQQSQKAVPGSSGQKLTVIKVTN